LILVPPLPGPLCEAAEPEVIDGHKSRGVRKAVNAVPAPAKDTAGVELASVVEGAATVKPEALEPWVGGEAGRERDMALEGGATRRARGTDTVPRESPTDGERRPEALLQVDPIEVRASPFCCHKKHRRRHQQDVICWND